MWSTSFREAERVAEEVEEEVVRRDPQFPFQSSSRKKKRNQSEPADEDEDDIGAFRQPAKLAKFLQSSLSQDSSCGLHQTAKTAGTDSQQAINSLDSEDNITKVTPQPAESAEGEEQSIRLSLEERCARQICRKWLKHTFLQVKAACDGRCGRLHTIPDDPKKMYSDFSFKGLPPNQQKKILRACMTKKSQELSTEISIAEKTAINSEGSCAER